MCFLHNYFPKHTRLQRSFPPLNSNTTGISYVAQWVILHKFYIKVLPPHHFLRVFIEFFTISFLFYVLFFGHEACQFLAPWLGIEPAPPALEGEVLTTGPHGKSLVFPSRFPVPGCWAPYSNSICLKLNKHISNDLQQCSWWKNKASHWLWSKGVIRYNKNGLEWILKRLTRQVTF